jgi:ribonuclease HII
MLEREELTPTLEREVELWRQGHILIAGIDEVGRGAWAGPVYAAAVILDCGLDNLASCLCDVRDSKMLSHRHRCELVEPIRRHARAVGIGRASHEDVDRHGIVAASFAAMRSALDDLALRPDYLLLDAFRLPGVDIPQTAIVKGDALCLSIAAASIVAKVARDALLDQLDGQYPGYGFAHNKGYGTAEHRQAIDRLGLCPIHRKSWRPAQLVLDLHLDE